MALHREIEAKCEGSTVPLVSMTSCPSDSRLCELLTALKNAEEKVRVTQANTKVLEQLVSLPRPTTLDANVWIESAKLTGEEQARLFTQEKLLTQEIQIKQSAFLETSTFATSSANHPIMQQGVRNYYSLWVCLFFQQL